jgi:hypothetical protein
LDYLTGFKGSSSIKLCNCTFYIQITLLIKGDFSSSSGDFFSSLIACPCKRPPLLATMKGIKSSPPLAGEGPGVGSPALVTAIIDSSLLHVEWGETTKYNNYVAQEAGITFSLVN